MKSSMLPPGPKKISFMTNVVSFYLNPVDFLQKITKEHGDIVYCGAGPFKVTIINHPDYIKDILVTNSRNFVKTRPIKRAISFLGHGLLTTDGDIHRRQRRLSQPAFHRERIATYSKIMTQYADRFRLKWRNQESTDISVEMMQLTMSIVTKALLGSDVESEAREIGEGIAMAMKLWRILVLPYGEIFEKLPLPSIYRFQRVRNRLDTTVYKIISERRESGLDKGDLLSMLLLARDEEGDGSGLSDLQVRDEIMTIFLAGHETLANALTWTWYLLSQNPEAEAKLHSEVDNVLNGRLPTYEDFERLEYTRMVFAESLRLYPPIWAVSRRLIDDYELDSYILPAGSNVFMSQYLVHRDPRFYKDPLCFDPNRWTPEQSAKLHRFAYFPFGGGPRQCIGESFAWMEGVLVIATIAQMWRMRLVPAHPVELQPLITLRPKYGMMMSLEKR